MSRVIPVPANIYYSLKKADLGSFLKAAMRAFCLVGPLKAAGGDFLLQEIDDIKNMDLAYNITSNTLKEFFFCRRETIFKYKKTGNGSVKITDVDNTPSRPTIFFGVRSCDIRAVYFQDHFFSREPKDALYWRRRNKAVLVSIACNKPPRHSCFCSLTKSGPFLSHGEGHDLQFMDLSTHYLVEVGSKRGASAIERYKKFFASADKGDIDKRAFLKEECLKEFGQRYDILKVHDKLKKHDLKELWNTLGARCTNCGGCEFICPTCFCFYQDDVKISEREGERIRAWDSCTFTGYSRMAAGFTPHEKNSDRIKRRFFCKLYNCYQWFGVFGCTGCGRCSFVCPVNLDMESFISSLSKGEMYKPLLKEL